MWNVYGAANDADVYGEWAKAIVHGRTEVRMSRKFAAGMIALRPDRDGTIAGYEGVEECERRLGAWLVRKHLPPIGSRTGDVAAGYHANAWLMVRHPDLDELRAMLDWVGAHVKVRAR
jgi:hypothetical protein